MEQVFQSLMNGDEEYSSCLVFVKKISSANAFTPLIKSGADPERTLEGHNHIFDVSQDSTTFFESSTGVSLRTHL